MGIVSVGIAPESRTIRNWHIERSIDVDQNLGLAIAADPVLLTAMAVMRRPDLDAFATLGDVIDQARFRRCQDQHPRRIGNAPRIAKRCHSLSDDV
jgi:hypothetical protein